MTLIILISKDMFLRSDRLPKVPHAFLCIKVKDIVIQSIKQMCCFSFCARKCFNEFPSGLITLHEFQRHFCNGTGSDESAEYAGQIFCTSDNNRERKLH